MLNPLLAAQSSPLPHCRAEGLSALIPASRASLGTRIVRAVPAQGWGLGGSGPAGSWQAELPRLLRGRASSSRMALGLPSCRHVPALQLVWRRVPVSRAGAAGALGPSVSGPPGPCALFCSEPTHGGALLPCSPSPQVCAGGLRTRVAWLLWLGSCHVSAVTHSRCPSLLFALTAPTAGVPWPQRGPEWRQRGQGHVLSLL